MSKVVSLSCNQGKIFTNKYEKYKSNIEALSQTSNTPKKLSQITKNKNREIYLTQLLHDILFIYLFTFLQNRRRDIYIYIGLSYTW